MKFGKELTAQMVQEWQEAYMDYNSLKKVLKDLMISWRRNSISSSSPGGVEARSRSLRRGLTMYRMFSGLVGRDGSFNGTLRKNDEDVIMVSAVEEEGSEHCYQTVFLRPPEDGEGCEQLFFAKLDEEFNKVVKFYKAKVQEVKAEAEKLSKQMDALIALRVMVDKPCLEQKYDPQMRAASASGNSSPPTVVASVNGVGQGGRRVDVIQEVEMSSEGTSRGEVSKAEKKRKRAKSFRPASLEVLDHVKIHVGPETPLSTIRNFVMSSESDLSFSRRELEEAEEKLRRAFIEFHHQLLLLKNFCFLNMLACSKIMKKYDKITSRSASRVYLDMVDKSYLGASNEVNKLIEKLEATFIKHFANGNHRKGMKYLRPGRKKERHRTTFFLGLFTGCSVALIAAIVVTVHARNLLNHEGRNLYMDNIFPLYSLFGLVVLHMLMYGTNTYLWRRYRVNYPFIFGFKPGTELGFREVFLVASVLSVLMLAAVLSNLDMEMDPGTQSYEALTELVPLGLVIVLLLITFCPFNILHRSSRFFLLGCAWRCLCAPFYKVTLPDFFLADQLTSQVQAFRSLQFYICYYGWGDFLKRSHKCLDSDVYEGLYIVVAIIPFWSRFLQCLRRLFEEKDSAQLRNCLKYMSTIVALVMRTIYDLRKGTILKILAALTSGITTIYSTYWDIVIDWGLLRRDSKNPWLRDKLLISNRAVYFAAIVVNILLRLVWMQSVFDFNVSFLHRKAMIAVVASLEILRRGIWNFFRVENEHFNNVGKYRAFKTVPLPFHYQGEKRM